MKQIIDIFQYYSNDIDVNSSENFEKYSINISFNDFKKEIIYLDVERVKEFVKDRDTIKIQVVIDGSDPMLISDEKDVTEVNASINIVEGSSCNILINITKNTFENKLSVYCLKKFVDFLLEKNLNQLLNVLSKYLSSNVLNKLEIITLSEPRIIFKSSILIVHSGNYEEILTSSKLNREAIINRRNLYSNSQNLSRYKFLPSDFNNQSKEEPKYESEVKLTLLIEKLKIFLSASFLANNSAIDETGDKFRFSINSNHYLNYESSFGNLDVNNAKSLFEIYLWVFEEGFLYDKLAISREVLMNNFKIENNVWYLTNEAIFTVHSAHNLYLKENIEKYLEVKNRMAEFSLELSVKTKELATDFTKALSNNHLTLVSFFISLFVFNALSGNQFTEIFTQDISIISYSLILISFIYLIVTILQMIQDLRRHKERFYNVKLIYKDIMTANELTTIFKHEIILNDISYIKKSMAIYSIMWIVELVGLSLMVFILSSNIDFSLWKDRIVIIVLFFLKIIGLLV